MKDSFLFPLRLGIRFLFLLAAIFLLVFIYYFIIEFSPSDGIEENWIAKRAVSSLSIAFFPAVLLTIISGYMLIVKRPGRMVPSFLIFFLCIAALFWCVQLVSESLGSMYSTIPAASVHERTILNYTDNVIYITQKDNQNVTNITLVTPKTIPPRMNSFQSGYIVSDTGMLKLDAKTIVLEPANPGISSLLGIPKFVSNVIRDMGIFKLIIISSQKLILLFSLYFCTLWIFSRISSWPLFNILLSIGMVRATLSIIFIIRTPLAERVLAAWNIGQESIVTIIFGVLSILFFVWDILFVPYSAKSKKKGADT